MMPNYEEMMKRQQESYQRSRDPFEYGQQVARRRYSEIMSGLDAQRMSTQQSYGDLYQQARQRAVRGQAMGGPTLSGGMGQQRRDFVSALEMQELGKIGTAREQAMRDLYTQGQAAFSNAQLEGQQAAQQELSNRAAALQLVQQRQAIMSDRNLSKSEKAEQLAALEGTAQGQGELTVSGSPISIGEAGVISAGVGIPATAISAGLIKSGSTAAGLANLAGKIGALKTTASGAGGAFLSASKAGAVVAKAGVAKGLGASFMLGLKTWAVKLGLAKGAIAVTAGKAATASLALTGLGPVGWGILAIALGAGAIAGISALTTR